MSRVLEVDTKHDTQSFVKSMILYFKFYLCQTGTLLNLQLANLDLVKLKDHPKTYINKEEEVSRE